MDGELVVAEYSNDSEGFFYPFQPRGTVAPHKVLLSGQDHRINTALLDSAHEKNGRGRGILEPDQLISLPPDHYRDQENPRQKSCERKEV